MLREAQHNPELFNTKERPSGSPIHPPGVLGGQQNALSTLSKGRGAFFRRWRAPWSLDKCPPPLSPLTTNSNMWGPHDLWESTAFCYDSLRASACWGGGRRETRRTNVCCGRLGTVSLNENCCLVEFLSKPTWGARSCPPDGRSFSLAPFKNGSSRPLWAFLSSYISPSPLSKNIYCVLSFVGDTRKT